MATSCLTSSSLSALVCETRTTIISSPLPPCSAHFRCPKISCFLSLSVSLSHSSEPLRPSSLLFSAATNRTRLPAVLALVEDEQLAVTEDVNGDDGLASTNLPRPCELYVCNLPRRYGISELLDLFKTYGTVQSVEVSRDPETGMSRGCGYVTMSSMDDAKAAIDALDGSDVGGREMRVRFSVDMNSGRTNIEALNSTPKKNLIFESPYKLYVGNLAWSVKPEDLKNLFTQFGTVVSARVLHDRKAGKNRVYGFLSFSSAAEREAAVSFNGTDFHGRTLIVREVLKQSQT